MKVAIMIAGVVGVLATPAVADDWQRAFFGHSSAYRNTDDPSYRYKKRYTYRQPEVRSWRRVVVEREDHSKREHGPRCRDRMTLVGDQHLSIDGAKEQAIKAWRQQARFAHGERFTEIGSAEDVTFRCVQSSIGEAMGASLHRCEVSAEPCSTARIPAGR